MKRIHLLLVLLAITIVSCTTDLFNNGNNNQSGIVIKGKISGARRNDVQLRSSESLSLSDAKKVLLINKNHSTLADINDSTFSVPAQLGTGVALLFLDSANRYIGNLSSKGLNLFPLGNLSNGANTTIDLSTLTLEGTNVIPSHDPLGNEIIISEAEINILKGVGEFYESIAKNMDADNDGLPDILTHKQIMLYSTFGFTNCGRWGHNDTLPVITESNKIYVMYQIDIDGGEGLSLTDSIIEFSGPEADPYTDIVTGSQLHNNGGFNAWIRRPSNNVPEGLQQGEILLPFKKGTYTLTLDGKEHTLNYSNMDAYSNLVLVVPTLHTNSQGLLVSISLEYRPLDGTLIDNPSNMVTNVSSQIVNQLTGETHDIYHGSTLSGQGLSLSIETGFDAIVPATPMNITPFDMVALWYQDLLGNSYAIIWNSKKTIQ